MNLVGAKWNEVPDWRLETEPHIWDGKPRLVVDRKNPHEGLVQVVCLTCGNSNYTNRVFWCDDFCLFHF